MPWLSLLVVLVVAASGCGGGMQTQWPQKNIFNEYFRQQEIKLGMSRTEVESIMGPPQVQEEADYQQGHFVLYFYRTHNMDYPESDTVRGGFTPLIFKDNVLVGKGSRAYMKAVDRSSWSGNFTAPPSPPNQTPQRGRSW